MKVDWTEEGCSEEEKENAFEVRSENEARNDLRVAEDKLLDLREGAIKGITRSCVVSE